MKQWKQKTIYFCVAAFFILMMGNMYGAIAREIAQAPDNPAYVQYLNAFQSKSFGARSFGRIPAPVDMSHLKGRSSELFLAGELPSAYDSRNNNRVSPIRNQGEYGTCWAHASLGALECSLLPGESYSFSPNHLANLAGFDNGYDDGGDMYMAIAYMTRWTGPVWESDDPYPNPGNSPTGLAPRKHIQNVIILPPRKNASDNDHIKNAIMQYGALDIDAFFTDDSENWNPETSAMYYSGTEKASHSLVVIGWDDNFSASNFPQPPPGNGAFLMKDSSGTAFGSMGGFYYISYYDTVIGYDEIAAFYAAEDVTNFGKVYQYDTLGLLGRWGYDTTAAYAANMFIAGSSGSLNAVGFYAVDLGTAYDIEIYTGCSADAPRSGTLRTSQSGVAANAGFYTIRLNSPVGLTTNERFSVVIRVTTSSATSPVPVELAKEGHSSKATANPGESFMSPDGVTWADTTTSDKTANVCLKAYVDETDGVTPLPLQLDVKANGSDGPITVTPSDTVSIQLSLDPGSRNGQTADWWIVLNTSFASPSDWFSYVAGSGWVQGVGLCAQAGLITVTPIEILKTPLPEGKYTFYFGLDDPDGQPAGAWWGLDSVQVNVE